MLNKVHQSISSRHVAVKKGLISGAEKNGSNQSIQELIIDVVMTASYKRVNFGLKETELILKSITHIPKICEGNITPNNQHLDEKVNEL